VALLKFPGLGLIAKFRYGLQMFLSTKRKNWQALDNVNARDWIIKWVGPETYEILWGALFRKKFYEFTDNLSAAWIWSRIKRVGLSRKNLMQEEMGYLEGGSDTLLKAMQADLIEKGVKVHLSSAVDQVLHEHGRVTGILQGGNEILCDHVISTVPLPFVPRLIPDMDSTLLRKYQAVHNIGVVCVIFKLHRAVTENFWLNVNDPSMDIPGIIEFSNLRPLKHHLVYVPFYLPHEHIKNKQTNEEFIIEAKSYLLKINEELKEEEFIDAFVSRYRFAQPICPPGFLDLLPAIKTNIDGLYIADTSYYYPEDRSISESVRLGRKIAGLL
jgi:protoporphyrinogen oxidase